MRTLSICISVAVLVSLATISTAFDMDHTHAQGANLIESAGLNQRFEPALATDNGANIDDFIAGGTNIRNVQAAFESFGYGHAAVTNWHLSIWSSVAAANASGTALAGDVISVDLGVAGAVYTGLPGVPNSVNPRMVEFAGLDITGLTVGSHYWMGLVPDLAFDPYGQIFLLACVTPANLGAGTANNGVFINPPGGGGGGFGIGTNAALSIQTGAAVPEPSTLAMLGIGAIVVILRRRTGGTPT